ncbi:MAG: protein kinase [Candidatus Krumholzibacteriota bacterium]
MPHCPSCSAEIPAAGRFCSACGAEVQAVSDTVTRTSPSHSSVPTAINNARFIPGTLLVGRYRIVGLLGRGGMGEVYRAEDLKLGQPVALKFLPAAMEKDDSRLARLLNEVRLARQVSHPNVCRVYDVDEVDGSHFMAMEYVDGEDLSSLLRRIGRLPHEKALEISRQICAGLAAAHEQGILHRDLKPANVMIDGRGRVKLADFGLANLAEGLEGAKDRSGTPAYMSPEQLAGGEVTLRSDIYSLGLVLYEVFTGQRAFQGSSLTEIASQHEQSRPTNPTSLVTQLDEIVEQVILRCLEKEPLARPVSALAVAAALPGGDPLAAALAAGETPSPEMVADAGAAGGLHPLIAVGALLAVLLSVVLSVDNAQRYDLEHKFPLDTPPGELASRALETLAGFGVEEPGLHRRFGFDRYNAYLSWLDEKDSLATDPEVLSSGSPPGARFWFRYSATEMEPNDLHGFFVSMDDPVQGLPGQGRIWLDLEGNLLGLDLVPDRIVEASGEPLKWSALFVAAGFDLTDFQPIEPARAPTASCDELMAWRGTVFEGIEGVVQAGRVGGAPTYFEILGPWDLTEEPGDSAESIPLVIGLLLFGVIVSSLFLARRNLRSGRSDTKGAFKLMGFYVVSICATWLLAEVRLDTLAAGSLFEQLVFGRLLAHGLTHGALIGLMYIALEPYVRRLWPETLVSWNRIMIGRVRDPLVGRDLLVGMGAVGLVVSMAAWLDFLFIQSLGITYPLAGADLHIGLSGIRYAAADLAVILESSIGNAMLFLVVLLIFRLVLRRNWAAFLAFVLLFSIFGLFGPFNVNLPIWLKVFRVIATALFGTTLVACVLRFGLLSIIGGMVMLAAMRNANLTWDFQLWYAGSGLLYMAAVVALAVWAFYISLAGRQLIKDSVLD